MSGRRAAEVGVESIGVSGDASRVGPRGLIGRTRSRELAGILENSHGHAQSEANYRSQHPREKGI